ncbi:uncharacterized protein BO66DRAFT_50051 [Aspergillus aculeatinus CBS 121060]|uniref:Uncharacterized protein n=1 Tax=Aspergillus aculeatinus CBS 121060 TaxID=1448322 RepID=A0ACD1HDD6_9EURO|nr:hypothetical protein BO66DRAFT_50051 [Aspergillus aculeatinus CBS 121060]RAH71842.1 hypothetical protein BO66DRAFT_50051 [Aspergillus aculeatinus CBS 121060]
MFWNVHCMSGSPPRSWGGWVCATVWSVGVGYSYEYFYRGLFFACVLCFVLFGWVGVCFFCKICWLKGRIVHSLQRESNRLDGRFWK